MTSEQVLTLAVRRYVIAGDRPFQDVMDAIYAGISRPDIEGLFRQLAASTSYEQFSALVAQAQGSAGIFYILQPYGIMKIRNRLTVHQMCFCQIFSDPVATNKYDRCQTEQ